MGAECIANFGQPVFHAAKRCLCVSCRSLEYHDPHLPSFSIHAASLYFVAVDKLPVKEYRCTLMLGTVYKRLVQSVNNLEVARKGYSEAEKEEENCCRLGNLTVMEW